MDRLDLAFKKNRQHDYVARRRFEQRRGDWEHFSGNVRDEKALLVGRALANKAFTNLHIGRMCAILIRTRI